jgi:hypothetical protein
VERLVRVALEDGEAFGHGADALGPGAAGCLVEHVEADAMGVHGDLVAEAAA